MEELATGAKEAGAGVIGKRVGINMRRAAWERIFSLRQREELREEYGVEGVELAEQLTEAELLTGLADCEVMLSSWGAVGLTAAVLERCPGLRLVIHGAGSVKELVTEGARERGIRFCNAAHVNARPVAEFCLGIILCHLKRVFGFKGAFKRTADLNATWWGTHRNFSGGYYRKRIGLISWGETARALACLLQQFEFEIYVDSEYVTAGEQAALGLQIRDLAWIMGNCDVISLHAAEIPRFHHHINRSNLDLMKTGSCLINTARGGLIDEEDLIAELKRGRIWAFLDVAQREPPPPGHPFYSLENCVLTPHISGSIGSETERLGEYCLRELNNWRAGRPLEREVNLAQLHERA